LIGPGLRVGLFHQAGIADPGFVHFGTGDTFRETG